MVVGLGCWIFSRVVDVALIFTLIRCLPITTVANHWYHLLMFTRPHLHGYHYNKTNRIKSRYTNPSISLTLSRPTASSGAERILVHVPRRSRKPITIHTQSLSQYPLRIIASPAPARLT